MNPNALTASRIKQLREATGLTQTEFAQKFAEFCNRKTSYSLMTIAGWENGRQMPPCDALTQLALYFDVTSDYLLGLSNDSKKTRKSDKVVSLTQRILVPYKDLAKHDGEALYIKFPDEKIKSQMGLLDYAKRQIVTVNYKLQLDQRCQYFLCIPPEEISLTKQESNLLNLKTVKSRDQVYIKSLSPDPYIQGLVTGWYRNDISGKFLINDMGRTLSYEGLGVTYNALDFKASRRAGRPKTKE